MPRGTENPESVVSTAFELAEMCTTLTPDVTYTLDASGETATPLADATGTRAVTAEVVRLSTDTKPVVGLVTYASQPLGSIAICAGRLDVIVEGSEPAVVGARETGAPAMSF